jgi:hypothetical protein
MNAPYPEHFALVHSLSDAALRTAANPAYLRLEKENITLRDRADNLQCVIRQFNRIYHLLNFTHRTQLITALMQSHDPLIQILIQLKAYLHPSLHEYPSGSPTIRM